jgi:hypothetical protein
MPYRKGHLFGQCLKQACGLLSEVIEKTYFIDALPGKIAGVKNPRRQMDDLNYGFPGREGLQIYVIKAILGIAGLDKLSHYLRDFFTELLLRFDIASALLKL